MLCTFRSLSYGAPLPGLCACAPADRGATKALKEEGKTQAEVAARVAMRSLASPPLGASHRISVLFLTT